MKPPPRTHYRRPPERPQQIEFTLPVQVAPDRVLFCAMCGTYRDHRPDGDGYKCRTCGRERMTK